MVGRVPDDAFCNVNATPWAPGPPQAGRPTTQWPAGIYLIEIRTEQDNHHVWVERMP